MKNRRLNTSSLLYVGLLDDDPQQEYGTETLVYLAIAGTRANWNRGFTTLPGCVLDPVERRHWVYKSTCCAGGPVYGNIPGLSSFICLTI